MMKKVIMLCTLLFSTHCFAHLDASQIHSAIENGFYRTANNTVNPISITYGGKDITQPKIRVANEETTASHFLG
jgi:hypothetical protein